ncbi:MAG: DUF3048 domain-containing protein [Anaerolineales bacterium]|nr:DUF3048 domain-containing protein [Anaerolineales bacterium]
MRIIRITLLIGAVLLTACRDNEAAAPTQTAVSPAPSLSIATVLPEATAVSTQTLPPPPTIAPVPTATQPPEPVDPNAITLLTPADFGSDRNPLTGELVDDPAVLQRRPLAVKISNAPPIYVRPQSGLNDADWVFEHTAEGHITRFTAIFYDTAPPKIGPIRSARLIDLELPAMFDAGLAFSGASNGVNARLNTSDFQNRIIYSSEQGYYRTGEDKPFEHTLYGDPNGFWQALDAKGENNPPSFVTFNTFSSEPPPGGEPASSAMIDYQWEEVEWRYDEGNGRYLRWAGGVPHLDGNSNEQVHAANVVIIAPFHVEDPTICEEIRNDQCTALSVQIQLWGSGSGIILRDGRQYPITWHRENRNDTLTFTDPTGNPFPLQIGSTWVQLVPTWYADPVSFGE